MFRKALAIAIVAAVVGLLGVLGLSLVAAQAQAASATRSLPPASVDAGDEVVVRITATGYGSSGGSYRDAACRVQLRIQQSHR